MTVVNKTVAKSHIRLREESDKWALLYDRDTGNHRVINPKIETIFNLAFEDRYTHSSVEKVKSVIKSM